MGIDIDFYWKERIFKSEDGALRVVGHEEKEHYIGGGMGTSEVLREIINRCIGEDNILFHYKKVKEVDDETNEEFEYLDSNRIYLWNRDINQVNIRPIDILNALKDMELIPDDNFTHLTPEEGAISNYTTVMWKLSSLFIKIPYYMWDKYIAMRISD